MKCRILTPGLLAVVGLALLLAPAPATAAPTHDRVPAGMDLWQTLGSGATVYSFEHHPIPAGFFCEESAAFTGTLQFEGVPLQTSPAGALGTTDTIVERLDDAVFNARGVAQTRIRIRALHLKAASPVHTACGDWTVRATLGGDQPVTLMKFRRTSDVGGEFEADLQLNVKLVFQNTESNLVRELTQRIPMPTTKTSSSVYACPVSETPQTLALTSLKSDVQVFAPAIGSKVGRVRAVTVKTTTASPNNCVVGTACNTNDSSQCMSIYSWHAPAQDERHFTMTPCNLGYTYWCTHDPCAAGLTQFCAKDALKPKDGLLVQLRELQKLGYINRSPEEVLERLANPGN